MGPYGTTFVSSGFEGRLSLYGGLLCAAWISGEF